MTATVYTPIEGINCPFAHDLKTGDLLFPRARLKTRGFFSKLIQNLKLELFQEKIYPIDRDLSSQTIRQLLKLKSAKTFVEQTSDTKKKLKKWNSSKNESATDGTDSNFDYAEFMRTVYPILESQFAQPGGVIDDWLDMRLDVFMRSKFGQFLRNALEAGNAGQDFFIGHVGLVIRTGDEDKDVYVIDENITDFAHYRVAIHPYLCAQTATPSDQYGQGAIGWANFHCTQDHLEGGRRIWQAEPIVTLTDDETTTLTRTAKEYLGRPYGFFDNPRFGDDDHMYCSEFIHRVFQNINMELTDRMTWGWMEAYLKRDGSKLQHAAIQEILAQQRRAETDPFFLLHPAALWCSSNLIQKFPTSSDDPYVKPVRYPLT